MVPASGRMGVYRCGGCGWGGCWLSVSCMIESGIASDVDCLEMGDVWSGDDMCAWWRLPGPSEAMVEVCGPVKGSTQFAVVMVCCLHYFTIEIH